MAGSSLSPRCVITPGIAVRLQQVGEGCVVETRIDGRVGIFVTRRIDQRHRGSRGRIAPGIGRAVRFRILRRKQIASGRGSRGPGNNELMRRHARPLVGLEHVVGEGVLLGHLEVGLHIGRVHVAKRQVGRGAVRRTLVAFHRNRVRPIHLALPGRRIQVAHVIEGIVTVVGVVVDLETDFFQRDGIAVRVDSALRDVGPASDQNRVLEKIIGRAVLLEDHHHVQNLPRQRRWSGRSGTTAAIEAHE